MADWSRVLIDGALLSLVAGVLIFASLWANPRIWLNDFPPDIRAAVPPKTAEEKRQSLLWGLPFLAVLLGAPIVSTTFFAAEHPGSGFVALVLNAFGVAFVFNIVDLLIIDWLVLCTLTPRGLTIPGTEGMAGYKDYRHHFRGFLIGTAFSLVVGLLSAAVVSLAR
jgi:hypothetical protein